MDHHETLTVLVAQLSMSPTCPLIYNREFWGATVWVKFETDSLCVTSSTSFQVFSCISLL